MCRTSLSRSAAGILLCILTLLPIAPAAAQGATGQGTTGQGTADERRIALVVGNFGYDHVPRLTNSGNDATLIAATLRQLGFTLVGNAAQQNVDKAHFDRLVQDFGRAIQGADVALFYYAGHGMQVDGNNWLVPTDANPTRPQDLEFQMVNADLVLKQMDGAGTRLNLVILDACRNNPFTTLGSRAVQSGLAQMRAPEGTMISFATQPGNVATDGSGANGPYATALAASMRQPGLDIFRVFNRVGLTVKHDTDGAQLPWVSSSPIDGEFYFAQTEAAPDAIATTGIDAIPANPISPQSGARTTSPTTAAPPPGTAPQSATARPSASPAAPPAATSADAAPAAPHDAANRLGELQGLAESGNADAQIDLGLAYAKGDGVTKDDAVARHWFELAAAQGAAKAQYLTGAMLERGRGGPRSYADALQWYHRAADQNYAPAEAAMGRFYGRGLGVEQDPKQRTDWFRRAADHGNPLAQWVLGNFYQSGNGVEKNMPVAVSWYERAATHGFALAQVRLGIIYEHGNAVRQDYAQALHWFRLAADAGNAAGLNNLGTFYRHGYAVPLDYAQAMALFHQAADKGNATAEYNIGLMYADGQGVKVDKQQAREWFEKAAAAGNEPAIARLARVDSGCSPGARPIGPPRPPGDRMGHPHPGSC
jgi:TPR repeat protein